jgi:hypothetical protein
MNKLLYLPYCGCINHWLHLTDGGDVRFEACGTYQRRTFRTRTVLMTANGPQTISVPVESDYGKLYRDIKINYDTPWAEQHQRAMLSAYNSTPFYEYYADDFAYIYAKHHTFVWDLNIDIMNLIAELIGVNIDYSLTTDFVKCPDDYTDLRIGIEPKYQYRLKEYAIKPYYQIFAQKHGFVPDLSILDLLFNMGPESKLILKSTFCG